MFRVTSILPPLSLSGSSTYSSLTLEDRRHRWVQSQLLFTEGKKKKNSTTSFAWKGKKDILRHRIWLHDSLNYKTEQEEPSITARGQIPLIFFITWQVQHMVALGNYSLVPTEKLLWCMLPTPSLTWASMTDTKQEPNAEEMAGGLLVLCTPGT